MGDVWADDAALIRWKGVPLCLTLSAESSTGYLNVCKKGTKTKGVKYYAKLKFKPTSEPQRTLPGSTFNSPKEAAAELAYFLAGHRGELPEKARRAARRTAEVLAQSSEPPSAVIHSSACSLLFVVCCAQEIEQDKAEKLAARSAKKANVAAHPERAPLSAPRTGLLASELPMAMAYLPNESPAPRMANLPSLLEPLEMPSTELLPPSYAPSK